MARLPSVQNFGERPTPRPVTGAVSYRATHGYEGAEAKAIEGFANTLQHVANEVERKQLQDDTLRAEDAFNQLREKQLELTSGKDGFVSRKSGDAVNQPLLDDYGKRLDLSVKEIADTLGNNRQRDLFARRAQVSSLQFKQDILGHVERERNVYGQQVFKSTLDLELRNAVDRYQDPSGIALSRQRMEAAIDNEAQRTGMPPEASAAMKRAQVSNLHTNVASRFIAEDQFQVAEQYMTANKEELDIQDRLKLEGMLKSKRNEISSELRVTIADRMQDIEAMGQRGIVPPKGFISDADIDTAYANNAERAAQIKRRRDEGYRFAVDASAMHAQSNDELIARINAPNSATVGENFAEQSRHNDMLRLMATNVVNQRLNAPMEYAAQQKIGVVNDIDFKNTESLSNEIANRQHTAKLMRDRYGSPIQLLTKNESANFSRSMSQATPKQKRELFQTFSSALGDDMVSYRAVMAQIAPDDPVTAMAGISANRKEATQQGQVVADLMLRGQAILHPPKKSDGDPDKGSLLPMPSENDMRKSFDSEVRDAFVGTADVVRNQHYQAARAIYASLSMDAGDKNTQDLNGDRWGQAIKLATGGIEKYKGKRTLMPFGYELSQFKQEVRAHIRSLDKEKLPDGITIDKLEDKPVVSYGDGKYVFMEGNSVLGYKDKTRIEIDLNQKLPPLPVEADVSGRGRAGRGFGAK